MLRHVSARAEQALLFPAPQAHPDGAVHLETGGFQDAHDFHHHGASRGVVRRARAAVPAIQVRADHHQLILLAPALDLADHVH